MQCNSNRDDSRARALPGTRSTVHAAGRGAIGTEQQSRQSCEFTAVLRPPTTPSAAAAPPGHGTFGKPVTDRPALPKDSVALLKLSWLSAQSSYAPRQTPSPAASQVDPDRPVLPRQLLNGSAISRSSIPLLRRLDSSTLVVIVCHTNLAQQRLPFALNTVGRPVTLFGIRARLRPPLWTPSASEVSSTLLGASASVLSTTTLPAQSSRARSPPEAEFGSRPLPRLSRSVSDDALLSSHHVHSTSHSLRQQLSFLVDAWMADRENCLLEKQAAECEARRLQVSIEGDRQAWASDKSAMERQLKMLRARVHRLELENASLKTATMRNSRSDDMRSPRFGLNGNSSQPEPDDTVTAAAASLSSNPSQQSNGSRGYIFAPPLEPPGISRRPHFATSGSSRTSPPRAPALCHETHRQDRPQQPLHATADFMCPSGVNVKGPVPVIDVQELDPKLDGIPIKANAVQKWTFSIAPNPRQAASKYRAGQGPGQCRARRQQNRRSMDRGRIARDRQTSRDQTLQVLAVEESRRLTMHAGHTPNHSLSLLPTMTAAGGDSDGGRSTHGTDAQQDADACAGNHDATQESRPVREPPKEEGDQNHTDADDDGFLDPCDDAPLKGPLMVKNIPAQDDLFFAQLDQKLEFVISGGQRDALPSVLRPPSPPAWQTQPMSSAPLGCPRQAWDGARQGEDEDVVDEGHEGEEDLEPDVPLRLRSTANFGAPFGSS
ncbi:hypothetical protein L249_8221 [Ophiocordyceps polyrhachis-furcata BCC 54312]|uniref:Uncharacterized protein n=1 Tax=Ophiocordyceps polyrhachis-furcata BCC 54312 TaxID=1330021 RepID=A0A367LI34_9HYPO|nr:hypothetical protein L249_8221 [Ophiocordyceps polyrhachis-furcata BCC 54312]